MAKSRVDDKIQKGEVTVKGMPQAYHKKNLIIWHIYILSLIAKSMINYRIYHHNTPLTEFIGYVMMLPNSYVTVISISLPEDASSSQAQTHVPKSITTNTGKL